MKRGPRRREITYFVPETNISFAEKRMEDFVAEYNWRQMFSARLPRGRDVHPTPTLLDLTVSAYLQGIEDTVQVSTARGFDFGGGKNLNGHQNGRSDATSRDVDAHSDGQPAGRAIRERDRSTPAVGAESSATRRDGPHDGFSEFALSMW